jgi:transposase
MIKDGQVRSLRRWLDEGCTLREAARRCGMDEKTARRYRKSGTVPTPRGPRSWRTRPDVFADVWPQVQARLESDSKLQAVTLFRELMREHPERFQECHRRTFERRINQWRATTGPARSVFFDQVHRPGRLASFDFTEVASLDITIQRTPFPHLLFHAVLTHSNVESVRICFSESFEALSAGLQAAFHEWGGVPERVRSDSLSAAVNNLSETREFRERYQALLAH